MWWSEDSPALLARAEGRLGLVVGVESWALVARKAWGLRWTEGGVGAEERVSRRAPSRRCHQRVGRHTTERICFTGSAAESLEGVKLLIFQYGCILCARK